MNGFGLQLVQSATISKLLEGKFFHVLTNCISASAHSQLPVKSTVEASLVVKSVIVLSG